MHLQNLFSLHVGNLKSQIERHRLKSVFQIITINLFIIFTLGASESSSLLPDDKEDQLKSDIENEKAK